MDLNTYIRELEQNTRMLLTAVRDVPIDQLNAKNGEKWSILEILEHIYYTDRTIHGLLNKPSENESGTKELFGYDKLETIVVDQRYRKVQSPNSLLPSGYFENLYDFTTAFQTQRDQLKNDLITGKIPVDHRIHNHFALGELTITDWLHMILFHTRRHLKQIEENLREKPE